MATFHFSLADGLTLSIESDVLESLHPEDVLLMGAYLPGAMLIEASTTPADLQLVHRQTTGSIVLEEVSPGSVVYHDTWTDRVSLDTWFLLYGLVRRALLARELFAVHAACVEDERGAILLVGHSGAGKTTVAQALVQHHAMRLVSGNKTVVRFGTANELEVIAGTRTMTLPSNVALSNIPTVGYQERQAFALSLDQYSTNVSVHVRAVVFVRLNDGVQTSETLSPTSALHRLVPFFLDTVNADVVLGHEGVVLCDQRPTGIESTLVKRLWPVLQTVPTFRIEGSLAYLVESISTL